MVNGGSGTVTLLPGVGQGFFDDQNPQTLFNLGSAVVQPPTFIGDSGVGYRRDSQRQPGAVRLERPRAPARASSSPASRSWPHRPSTSGQVVVALADGDCQYPGPKATA